MIDGPGQRSSRFSSVGLGWWRTVALASLAAATTGACTFALEHRAPPPDPPRFSLAAEDIELVDLTRVVAIVTGRRFVLADPLPTFRTTIIAPGMVTADEFYAAFVGVLKTHGLTIQRRGSMELIVDERRDRS